LVNSGSKRLDVSLNRQIFFIRARLRSLANSNFTDCQVSGLVFAIPRRMMQALPPREQCFMGYTHDDTPRQIPIDHKQARFWRQKRINESFRRQDAAKLISIGSATGERFVVVRRLSPLA
jgi:hypothetical protein